MGARILIMAVLAALWTSSASAEPKFDIPPPVAVTPLPAGTPVRTISLTKVVSDLDPDRTWATLHWNLYKGPLLRADRGRLDLKETRFDSIFYEEMGRAGFQVEGDPGDLFDTQPSTSEFALGGAIKGLKGEFTVPSLGSGREFKGRGVMEIEWQLYSRLERRVVARITTRGGVAIDEAAEDNVSRVLRGSFAENVRALASSAEFKKFIIGSGSPRDAEVVRHPDLTPIVLHGPTARGPRPIAEAAESVAIIFAGDGHGSGFLVSSDGLVLTDQHVVGTAQYVKVRWPDGVEGLGEVVRSDRIRDVALVKTDAHGRQPLRLRVAPMQPGETVFAIGAPLYQEFQGTVTRGVISANRTFDGLSFLQSDVTVNPGNSGGPLIDEQGAVVGMTESGIRPEGAPSGLNLFTPIGDALRSLNAQAQ